MEPLSISFGLLIATIIVVGVFIYNKFKNQESWAKCGVKEGTMGKEGFEDFPRGLRMMIEEHGDIVGMKKGKMFLITRDLDLLRQVMVKDFNNFVDRSFAFATTSLMDKALFFMGGQDWKRVRQIITPSFSSGKIKSYAKTVDESSKKLTKVLEELARRDQMLPIKHVAGQYTSAIISRLAFGLETDCLGKEDDEFTHYSKNMFKNYSKLMNTLIAVLNGFPSLHAFLVKKLRISLFDQIRGDADVYFRAILDKTLQDRHEMANRREKKFNDLLQSLIAAKEEGDKAVTDSSHEATDNVDDHDDNSPKTMTHDELIGQAMLILFAGFETTSTALQFCLYLLAKHPEIQEKVYQEIRTVVKSDTPSYDDLAELKYLSQVIDETLRLYPPAPLITRKALETTTHKSITIPKGTAILIPLDTLMTNPKYFPDPFKFDPDRFSEENKAKRDPMAFMPFGYGPRICVGLRLAYLELKYGLVHVLRKIKVELNQHTEPKEGGDITTTFQGFVVVDNPIQLALRLRNNTSAGYHNLIEKHGDTVGISMGKLILITRDLDIVKQIMVKNFNNFVDRDLTVATKSPLEKCLFLIGGQDWKRIRHILSPSFSTGKLKMFSKTVDEKARKLAIVIEELARREKLVPIKHTSSLYSGEIIARLAFGLHTDCISKGDDEFTNYSKKMFKIRGTLMNMILLFLFRFKGLTEFLAKKLHLSLFDAVDPGANVYFNNILHDAVAERRKHTSQGGKDYHDFLQTLITAKEEGDRAVAAGVNDQNGDENPKTMTDEELMGQAMLIIFAGFDSISTVLQMCFYHLAKFPKIQEKVYQEIKAVVTSETPTYEQMSELKYMGQVIDETLRLFPASPMVSRKAEDTTTIGAVTIPKGTLVIIPLDMIMLDPKHYPEPEKFDPDRFTEENKASRDPMAFIPFGGGPRICIGMRLAYLELKLGMVHVLRKVKFELNENTEPKPGGDVTTSFQGFIVVDKPIQLAVKVRED